MEKGEIKMKKYKVIANDDWMKYQVIDTLKETGDPVVFEDDGKSEAQEVCDSMNKEYEENLKRK
jgi:hypothetical protein